MEKNIEVTDSKEKPNLPRLILIIIVGFILVLPLAFITTIIVSDNNPATVVQANVIGVSIGEINFDTYTYGFDDTVPEELSSEITSGLEEVIMGDIPRYELNNNSPQILFTTESNATDDNFELFSSKLLLVGHPYWIVDNVSLDSLSTWKFITTPDLEEYSKLVLNSYIDQEYELITLEDLNSMLSYLELNEGSVGLISPDMLEPKLRLLTVDGNYYLDDPTNGALAFNLDIVTDGVPDFIPPTIPAHIDTFTDGGDDIVEGDLLSLRQTGVTAISRNLAIKIERSGDNTYPSHKIAEFLKAADFTHTSNEVSFVDGCVPEQSLRFCSAPEYIETLIASGIDIVELTGNHNNDYGAKNNATSIDIYEEMGWTVFGGGRNSTEASEIKYIEKDGSTIALIGYNWYDTILNSGAIAGQERAGANSYSEDKVVSNVAEAKLNADFVIVDFQFQECYSYPEGDVIYPPCYKALVSPDQKKVFRQAIDAGADMVVGTQAHQPQTFELYNDKYIFYGLGNIYFDQIRWTGTRQGLILTHYIKEGKHIQTKIDTTIYDRDMKPYVTHGDQRTLLFTLLENARP